MHLLLYLILIIISFGKIFSEDTWCYDERFPERQNQLPDFVNLASNERPPIFFLETTCLSSTVGKVTLNPRQGCAIESAALANPSSDIYVLFIGWAVLTPTNDSIIEKLLNYKNIYFKRINLANYTAKTLVAKLYNSKEINRSPYAFKQTNDMLRLLTLWKYGGTFLDMDVISRKGLKNIGTNYVGTGSDETIHTAVMSFDKNGVGHKFLGDCLRWANENFQMDVQNSLGDVLITRLMKLRCQVLYKTHMDRNRCKGIIVYPSEMFYPIPWKQWMYLFDRNKMVECERKINSAVLVHTWDSKSSNMRLGRLHDQAISLLAFHQCPQMYNSGKWSNHAK